MHYVSYGSWLCENAKLLDDDRRSYSSKTALGHQLAIAFNFKIELKNVILVAFRTFSFSHSQGQTRKCPRLHGTSVVPSRADVVRPPQHVRLVPLPEVLRLIRSPRRRADEHRWQDLDAELFCCLAVRSITELTDINRRMFDVRFPM